MHEWQRQEEHCGILSGLFSDASIWSYHTGGIGWKRSPAHPGKQSTSAKYSQVKHLRSKPEDVNQESSDSEEEEEKISPQSSVQEKEDRLPQDQIWRREERREEKGQKGQIGEQRGDGGRVCWWTRMFWRLITSTKRMTAVKLSAKERLEKIDFGNLNNL